MMTFSQPLRLAAALAVTMGMLGSAHGQADSTGHAAGSKQLLDVPTTKILAIGRLTARADRASIGALLPQEVSDTVRIYLKGTIEQWYAFSDRTGVVFVLNVQDVEKARSVLDKLPLGRAGLMEFDFIPIGPLAPLGLLAGPPSGESR